MDIQKFGAFIAENRKAKGMTQADLAKKLQITDKAVSRWERGIGFPDIGTIEPLALGLSIFEIMKPERTETDHCSDKDTADLMQMARTLEKENRKEDLTATVLAIFTTVVVSLLLWLSGHGNLGGFVFFGALVSVAQICIYYDLSNKRECTKPQNLRHHRRRFHSIRGRPFLSCLPVRKTERHRPPRIIQKAGDTISGFLDSVAAFPTFLSLIDKLPLIKKPSAGKLAEAFERGIRLVGIRFEQQHIPSGTGYNELF